MKLTIKQVAKLTHKDPNTVGRWIRGENLKGTKLPTTRKGLKHMIDLKDLKKFLLELYEITY